MILTCPKCQSRYDVDPTSISEAGTYAHCRTCENIFFVKRKKKPGVKPASQVEAVAADSEPEEDENQPASASEIEAAIAEISAELNPQTAGQHESKPEKNAQAETAKANSPTQEEIDSLLSAVDVPDAAAEQPAMSGQDEVDAMLASVNTTEEDQATPDAAPPEDAPVEAKAEAEKPATSQQDEIDAMLASVNTTEEDQATPEQPVPEKATPDAAPPEAAPVEAKAEAEKPAMSQQDEIDAMLASVNTTEEDQATPEKPAPDAAPPEAAPVEAEAEKPATSQQDEVDAMLASVNTTEEDQAAPEQAAPEQATPEKAAPDAAPPENAPVEAKAEAEKPAMSQQDEIDAMLASVNTTEEDQATPEQPVPEEATPEQATPEKVESQDAPVEAKAEKPATSQQDEVDAMLASIDTTEEDQAAPEQAAPEKVESQEAPVEAEAEKPAISNQDDEELNLAVAKSVQSGDDSDSGQTEKEADDTSHTAELSVDDIESLLGDVDAGQSSESASSEQPKAKVEEETVSIASADIDSLLSGVKETPVNDEMETVVEPPEKPDTSSETPEIDASATESEDDGDVISQDDLDDLFAKPTSGEESTEATEAEAEKAPEAEAEAEPEPKAEPEPVEQAVDEAAPAVEEGDSPKVDQPEDAATMAQDDQSVITQGDLDTLFASDTDGGSDEAAKVVSDSSTGIETGEKQLESLFESESTDSIPKEEVDEAVKDNAEVEAEKAESESDDVWDNEEAAGADDSSDEAGEKKGSLLAGLIAKIRDKMPRFGKKKAAVSEKSDAGGDADDADDFITELTKKKKKRPRKLGKRALAAAAVLLLALSGGLYYMSAGPDIDIVSTKSSAPNNKVETPAQKDEPDSAKLAPTSDDKKVADASVAGEGAMGAAREVASSELKLGIMLPVDFNAEAVKVLSAEIFIRFKDAKELLTAQSKRFLYELAVENEIETFFKDRFYEDTHYVQDKLVAELYTKFRRRADMETIKEIAIENFKLQ